MGEKVKGEVTNGAADSGDFTGKEGEYWGSRGDLGERAENWGENFGENGNNVDLRFGLSTRFALGRRALNG